MYEILLILIFILSILYTIDNKPLNIVIDFILIIINISILLFYIDILDISFFSFILIIIYASALAILFGLIMMLFNNISCQRPSSNKPSLFELTSPSTSDNNNSTNISTSDRGLIPSGSIFTHSLSSKNFSLPLKFIIKFPSSQSEQVNLKPKLLSLENLLLKYFLNKKQKTLWLLFVSPILILLLFVIIKFIIFKFNNFSFAFYLPFEEQIKDSSSHALHAKQNILLTTFTCETCSTGASSQLEEFLPQEQTKFVPAPLGNFIILKPLNIDLIKIIFIEIYTKNYINIILIIIILLISLIGIIFLLI